MKPAYHVREDQLVGWAISEAKRLRALGIRPMAVLESIKLGCQPLIDDHMRALRVNMVHPKFRDALVKRCVKAARRVVLTG